MSGNGQSDEAARGGFLARLLFLLFLVLAVAFAQGPRSLGWQPVLSLHAGEPGSILARGDRDGATIMPLRALGKPLPADHDPAAPQARLVPRAPGQVGGLAWRLHHDVALPRAPPRAFSARAPPVDLLTRSPSRG
ncbi:hypothetical protein LAZ40_22125 [Cereibacter sphaeroides]|uniref:hypothetical protein n=1 Tax=Cereibacter sphaeroides TaxID=1063 RepID=UPI001F190CE9|nr:hypothetical protein [Cereibacter sphaeroides]MCE6961735.1 hypothetical protein [Cereibacter sphaeroides]MCE6975085.1 hypothetical protein [Cereibacter sphaeroides]